MIEPSGDFWILIWTRKDFGRNVESDSMVASSNHSMIVNGMVGNTFKDFVAMSHLLFANDNIFFSLVNLRSIIRVFEMFLGLTSI